MSRIFSYLGEAAASLWRSKVRSALTMLGMIIGTSSIVTVFGLSKAATSGIEGTINSFGTFPVTVTVDASQNYPDRARLRYEDANRVAQALGDDAYDVQPTWVRTWKVQYDKTSDYYTIGTLGVYQDDSLSLNSGRKIDASDVASAARVVVLSQSVADKFHLEPNAVGKTLTMNGARYELVGVYAPIESPLLTSLGGNDFIAIPYTTFYRAVNEAPDELSIFPAQGADPDGAGAVAVKTLQHVHGPQSQYQVDNGSSDLKAFENVLNIAGTGLAAIGGVALVVAGIGIMNIMLVTVTERTKEIGLRKSIGASKNDIMLQFLMESLLLALLGGGTGIALGIMVTGGGAVLLSKQLGAVVIPYVLIVSIAIGFSGLVGMIFGLYPAYRAASMDPIEALRS